MVDDPDAPLTHRQLDELVVTIELTLVSLAQGLALAALASSALPSLISLNWQYWPYIASGVVLILFFWTQAISHALSFVRWPIVMAHNVVYFLAMLVEVVLFSQVANPLHWFAVNVVFYLVAFGFYWLDLGMIEHRKRAFERAGQAALYRELVHDQLLALRTLIPFGFLFSLVSALAILAYPGLLIDQGGHTWLGLIQAGIGTIVLARSLRDFQAHTTLLEPTE